MYFLLITEIFINNTNTLNPVYLTWCIFNTWSYVYDCYFLQTRRH